MFEVYLILWLMGAKVSSFAALAIEALTKLVNVVGAFNPGNIGTYEGGNMLIVRMFGLSGAAGLTLAFTRRLRAIFWAAVGGLCLVAFAKSRKQGNSDGNPDGAIQVLNDPISPAETPRKSRRTGHSHIAIVLANNLGGINFGSPLPQVGALPVLLRAILGAQKAGAARILVVIDRETGPWIQRALLRTYRLPQSVAWFEVDAAETPLAPLMRKFVEEAEAEGNLVLIAGDRTYHPSLHRRAGEWSDDADALALMTGKELAGIYAIPRHLALALAQNCPSNAGSTLDGLHDWVTMIDAVRCEPVPKEKWQRVVTPQQCVAAEQKLDHWLVKPTDGIFARMNRRVSIPISRQLIRFPVTPNMVTLFTLGVSFAAGVFFALGGYWKVLVGAILSVFASILDGCDGEVARLTLQESDFGCWLETICDYLYYLFIFAGMTIGLVRSSGTRTYLIWGAFLVFGAIASFLTIALQRHQLTTGRPEQYLGVWHKEADSRGSNPLLYLGRHTEFIIRRCFLPYAFLFFAIFNIMKVAFIMTAVGANLVWIIALYSYLTFPAVQAPRAANPATSI